MFTFPNLELTEWERKFVRAYAQDVTQDGKRVRLPGVLKRVHPLTISNTTNLAPPSASAQISRRSRLFALTFSGDISTTRLQITSAEGTLYTMRDPRTNRDPYVSALIAGSLYMEGAAIGSKPSFPAIDGGALRVDANEQIAPLLIDPNWVLNPNTTLIFNGTWTAGEFNRVLNIGLHVWEFPGWDRAVAAMQEVA